MIIGVKILPRKEVLDSQGRAIEKTLEQNAFAVSSCRVGKYVLLEFDTDNKDEALKKTKEIVDFVLHNPLVETFEMEVVE